MAVLTVERIAQAIACSIRWTSRNQSCPVNGGLVRSMSPIVRCIYSTGLLARGFFTVVGTTLIP